MTELVREIEWGKYFSAVEDCLSIQLEGRVAKIVGLIVEGVGLNMGIGNLCEIYNEFDEKILAEVVGFKADRVLLMPYGDVRGVRVGSRIVLVEKRPAADVGDEYLGRVIDGMGKPLDGSGPVLSTQKYPLYGEPV